MPTTRHELMWGRSNAPQIELIGGFAILVVGTLIATALANVLTTDHLLRRILSDIGLPLVVFYAPGLVTAVGAYFRCGAVACLIIGLIPATFFALVAIVGSILGVPGVGSGDAPLWSITLAFAVISLVIATVGFIAGTAIRSIATRTRQRTAGR